MELAGTLLLGFFIGFLCGLIPLVHGLLIYRTASAIIGLVVSSLSGLAFSLLDKSPFIAIFIALIFVVMNIAAQKRNVKEDSNTESEELTQDNT